MAAITGGLGETPAARAEWARKYPPLLTIAIALLIAITILPSSLNLPQSNPTETLEYAPVPPNDEDSPPNQTGNFASLGLGRSAGIGSGDGEGTGKAGAPTTLPKRKKGPAQKSGGAPLEELDPPPTDPDFRCVGDPPRQTDDPLSPPCVPFYDGDNGCQTYGIGVTCDEVRLVIYIEGGINYINGSNAQNRVTPTRVMYDLARNPGDAVIEGDDGGQPEHLQVSAARVWQAYFNQRFQTYNRKVHFFVYFSGGPNDAFPEGRRRNAATIYDLVKPFAVISLVSEGGEDEFLRAMSKKGVLNFGSFGLRDEKFFQDFPKMIWSFLPSIQRQAENYSAYLCTKVVPHPPSLASDELKTWSQVNYESKRRLGIIYTTDPNWSGLEKMAGLVKEQLAACGYKDPTCDPEKTAQQCLSDIPEAPFSSCCVAQDNGETPDYAILQMQQFQQDHVTTILWVGGINGNYGKTASSRGYFPEWIIAGDGLLDSNRGVVLSQNSSAFDGRAIIVTPQTVEPGLEQRQCARAFREIAPNYPSVDLGYVCNEYYNFFQFFSGVQVSGPRLGPTNLDRGFHAIPQRKSGDPTAPACFYLPGDYTCVKDAEAEIWSAQDRPPGTDATGAPSTPGCWKPIEGGARYIKGLNDWPGGNIHEQLTGNEQCNGYSASVRFNIA